MPRPPARLAALLATASLIPVLVASCDLVTGPSLLTDRTVPLGVQVSREIRVGFGGSWSVAQKPAWLSVSRSAGTGEVDFTLTADRGAATPLAADQPRLSGELLIKWTSPRGRGSGTARWTVTAEQYALSGRVVPGPTVLGRDLRIAAAPAAAPGGSHGVIVRFRTTEADGAAPVSAQGLASSLTGQAVTRTLRSAGLRVGAGRDLGRGAVAWQVSDVPRALRLLRADPRVESAVPNAVLRAQALAAPLTPTDQYAPVQWPYRLLGYPAVWRDMEGGGYDRPVTVAVVDSGVRFDHPDLVGTLWGPGEGALDVLPRFVNEAQTVGNGDGDGADTDPTDPDVPGRVLSSHGTHVTGIIAARWGDNGATCDGCSKSGVAGALYRANVRVLPIRALDAQGETDVAQVSVAVRYAAGLPVTLDGTGYLNPHPAQVINLSLGGEIDASSAQPMCDAIRDATVAGALIVAAGGNGYGTAPYFPAACPDAVAVASVTLSGASAPRLASYSNVYPEIQLSAPGGTDYFQDATYHNGASWDPRNDGQTEPFVDSVLSTGWDYGADGPIYEIESGTSQAAPQVSALAALLLSKGTTTDAASTLARLRATATDLGAAGRDPRFGFGMINAAAALGAPAISDTLGLRLQDARGLAFQPALDPLGRFTAYLGDGTFRVVAGRDRNGNGVYGEASEPASERVAVLGPQSPAVDVGTLNPE